MTANRPHIQLWRGTLAQLASMTDAVLGTGKGVRVGDIVAIEDGGTYYLARVTSATEPATGLISYASSVAWPGSTATGDLLYLGSASSFARSASLGYDSTTGVLRAPMHARASTSLPSRTPSGTPASWQPSITSAVIETSFDADLTLTLPTTAVPAGLVEATLRLTNSHATLSKKVLLGAGFTVSGIAPDMTVPPGGMLTLDIFCVSTGSAPYAWKVRGRNPQQYPLFFDAPAPTADVALMELPHDRALRCTPALLSGALAWCAYGRTGGAFTVRLQQYTTAWQNIAAATFPAPASPSDPASVAGVWSFNGSADIVIPAGVSRRWVCLTADGGVAGATNLRGFLPVLI
jgi:hypothetical protein